MHRKTSTAAERLIALRTLIVVVASRAGVASAQVVVIVLASVRRREGMAGFAYATMLTFAIVAGTAVGVQGDSPAPSTVAVAGAQDRLAAAERADRSSRTDVASPSDATSPAPAAPDPAAAAAQPAQMLAPAPAWVSPMPGAAVSSCYGPRWGAMHMGMDFAGPNGTPILASGGGTIFGVGWLYSGYGMSVVIDHGNGFFTHYAHASRINVAVGQQVSAGQTIAWEGSTGNSTGPHLHFEVHQGLWNQVNPAQFLRDRGAPIGC